MRTIRFNSTHRVTGGNSWLIVLFSIALMYCGNSQQPSEINLPFNFTKPDSIIALPSYLKEISGLSWKAGELLAIQDESGRAYRIAEGIDAMSYPIIDFAGKGDFEAVEWSNEGIYALTSDGEFYNVSLPDSNRNTISTDQFQLPYRKKENFEGMCRYPDTARLIIVAKESPENEKKHMYPLDPMSPEQTEEPIYTFDVDTLRAYHERQERGGTFRFADWLSDEPYSFNPSGVAIDPLSGDYYVLSYPVQQLLVLTPDLDIKACFFLKPLYFQQPEGICFDAKGNCYISNEGKSGNANILLFRRGTFEQ